MVLNIEGSWLKTEMQLEIMQKLWDSLDGRIQIHFMKVLRLLREKLQVALTKLATITTSVNDVPATMTKLNMEAGKVRRWKMLFFKDTIDDAIRDLEDWQRRLDPSWYLIARLADPKIDQTLRDGKSDATNKLRELRDAVKGDDPRNPNGSIFVDSGCLIPQRRKIVHSSVSVSIMAESREAILLDRTNYPPDSNRTVVTSYVRDLARLLSKVDPSTFSLLHCYGVIKRDIPFQFDLVFNIPPAV